MFLNTVKCDWCEHELNDYYLIGYDKENNTKLKFCNFVCAKHYNDILRRISVDFDKYAFLYYSGKLDKMGAKIFKNVYRHGFEFMPTVYSKKYNENKNIRQKMTQDYIFKIYDKS